MSPQSRKDASAAAEYDVLIVGAGVGGAALALALVSGYGLRVAVIDRRSGPGNINRGDSLLPAVTATLREYGALPALLSAGARPLAKMQVFHHRLGRLLEAPLSAGPAEAGRGAAPYLVLAHPEIERALLHTAVHGPQNRGQAEVRYRCRLRALLRDEVHGSQRVVGARVTSEGGEQTLRARLVVGADGAASTVRELLGLSLPTRAYDHGYYIVECQRPPPGQSPEQYEDAMRIELHPAGGILVVPQGSDRLGLGVLVRAREHDLFRAGPLPQKLAAIAARSPLLRRLGQPGGLFAHAEGAHLYSLARGHARHYHRDGAVLIGDALHVTNPTAGQGMTMAIEDAAALARHIGPPLCAARRAEENSAHHIAPDPTALLRALSDYERERWPKNDAQIRWSHWLSRCYALEGAWAEGLTTAVFRFGASRPGQAIQRLIWSRLATRARPAHSPAQPQPAADGSAA